jgi:rhodanese-related sulfurtransferase
VIEVAPARAQALADQGVLLLDVREDGEWRDVHNLTGGIIAWAKSGLPLTASTNPPSGLR